MKKLGLRLTIVFVLVFLTGAGGAFAATANVNQTVNAAVGSVANLSLGATAINFPSADPDVTSSIPATENGANGVQVVAKARTGSSSSVTLTVTTGNLTSGSDTILPSNVSWTLGTGSASGYAAGSMGTAQSVGSWTGSGSRTGYLIYAFTNSWSYAPGSYSATAAYTLTAP